MQHPQIHQARLLVLSHTPTRTLAEREGFEPLVTEAGHLHSLYAAG